MKARTEVGGARRDGILVSDLSTLLKLNPRRGRHLVTSLVRRDLVTTSRDAGTSARRVWLPKQHRAWLFDRSYVAGLLASYKEHHDDWRTGRGGPTTCPNCGWPCNHRPK